MENVFHGGKYGPGILFIGIDEKKKSWPYMAGKLLKRTAGQPYRALRGEYWVGGNNTTCFKPVEGGKHVLMVQEWTMSTKGYDLLDLPTTLWSKTTRSNNGRSGFIYAICFYDDVKEWC